ncbi:MAG: YeeE/YedE thiosulfate transporter family protein [Asticcacaulis sp.]
MIGLAAGGLYLTTGRIAGVSGIFGDSFLRTPGLWRWLFVAGLILAGLVAHLLGFPLPAGLGGNPILLAIAGLLVGFGTRLGNGCTSGHGVCGLARLSVRSLTAVIVFMAAAALTVYVTHHIVSVPL